MIPRKARVPRSVFSEKPGKKIFSSHFTAAVFDNDLGRNRFAAIVSQRAEKLSVKRHFWKRIIMRASSHQPPTSKDVVIYAKPGLKNISEKEATEELEIIFKKITDGMRRK